MKLPKTLTHAILAGIAAGTMAACSFDVVTHDDLTKCGPNCTVESCTNNKNISQPFNCPACGLG